jgi:hypothetical protein
MSSADEVVLIAAARMLGAPPRASGPGKRSDRALSDDSDAIKLAGWLPC